MKKAFFWTDGFWELAVDRKLKNLESLSVDFGSDTYLEL